MAKSLVVANWKMNPASIKEAVLLARKVESGTLRQGNVEIVVAPPFPFLIQVGSILKRARLGAQDISGFAGGLYTGEVSGRQLRSLKVSHAIIGHSERKIHLGETDVMINRKVRLALKQGIKPVLCVGERERQGRDIPAVVGEQLRNALGGISPQSVKKVIVAYEPVWAISTMPGAKPDTPDSAFRAKVYIRRVLTQIYKRTIAERVPIIYGGSVNSKNIGGFMSEGKMEGALVGGASLNPREFIKIVAEVNRGRSRS